MYSPFKTGAGAIEDTNMDESCEGPQIQIGAADDLGEGEGYSLSQIRIS
jgi:hypothetical protein